MTAFREPGFKERQEAAAKAKQAALDKLRARQKPVEPAAAQQEAERVTSSVERTGAKKTRAVVQKAASKPAGKEVRAAASPAEQKAARKRDAPPKARKK
jgi:hypothetical protein